MSQAGGYEVPRDRDRPGDPAIGERAEPGCDADGDPDPTSRPRSRSWTGTSRPGARSSTPRGTTRSGSTGRRAGRARNCSGGGGAAAAFPIPSSSRPRWGRDRWRGAFRSVALGIGLSAKAIRESASRSMARLGVPRLDLMYAHIEDPSVPAEETVGAFGELVASGEVGLLGVSNHWSWRVERARSVAVALGVPGYEVLQYHYSYLRPRADLPGRNTVGAAQGDLLSLVRASPSPSPGLTMVAYSPLLSGGYVRADRPLGPEFDHAGTSARLAALRSVAWRPGRRSTRWCWPG